MSQANGIATQWKNTPDRDEYLRHVLAKTAMEKFGEDLLYHCEDGSIVVHRAIVNELQLFKGVDTHRLAAKRKLSDEEVKEIKFLLIYSGLTFNEIARLTKTSYNKVHRIKHGYEYRDIDLD